MRHASLIFADRHAAGAALGRELRQRPPAGPLLVLGLPRGGVPVAAEVARALDAPLDVLIVRKIGLPSQPELAIGALAGGGILVRDPMGVHPALSEEAFAQLVAHEREELGRRERVYRAGRGPLELAGQTVVLVDDGLATGATMLAAVRAMRHAGAARIIVAVPVASPQAVSLLAREADQVIALEAPASLFAIGQWYEDFAQLDDRTVCMLLEQDAQRRATREAHKDDGAHC
jgi:predicted phosphoribosyltransferase